MSQSLPTVTRPWSLRLAGVGPDVDAGGGAGVIDRGPPFPELLTMADPTEHLPPPAAGRRRYCVVTPCRDEAAHARRTLASVAAQTERPALWVIVDDGSTDGTAALLAAFARGHAWVRVVTRADRGERRVGAGVVDAFYDGYATVDAGAFEYVCKLDLDLEIPADYFARMMDRMEANPRLATVSGKPYMPRNGRLVPECCGDENSVGMIKFYRRQAFEQIGGFVREVMWDGIDGHRCRMLGWQAQSVDDADCRFLHLRPMGSSHRSLWAGRVRHGFGQYYMGTGLFYMLASCLFRLGHRPVVLGSVAMLWGWLRSAAAGRPRYDDAAFRRHLAAYHRASLVGGKAAATRRVDAERHSAWRP